MCAPPPGPQTGPVTGTKLLRCVIVDDNAGFLTAATRLLERQGIAVVGAARSVTEGLCRVALLRPDVVLVDVHLGAERGIDLVDRLRVDAVTANVQAIMISTVPQSDIADLMPSADGFMSKLDLSAAAIRQAIG